MSTSRKMDMKYKTHTNNGMIDIRPSLILEIVLYCIRMHLKLDFSELDYCTLCMPNRRCKLHTREDKANIVYHWYNMLKSINIYAEY